MDFEAKQGTDLLSDAACCLEVCLVSPPCYYPWSIPPGLAYLAGYLKSAGYSATVLDANVEALEYTLALVHTDHSRVAEAFASLRDCASVRDWKCYQSQMRFLSTLAALCGEGRAEKLRFGRNTLRYYPAFELRSRAGLLDAISNSQHHIFLPYYKDVLIPKIRQLAPAVVGISASDLHQLLPGTIIASELRRELGAECPQIVLGGNVFSRLREVLARDEPENRLLFDIWGSVVVGEGEQPLLRFLRSLSEGTPTEGLEGILSPHRPTVPKGPPLSMSAVSAPRCEGFKPLTPELPIPLNIYRGCYLSGVCQFCDINHGYDTVWNRDSGRAVQIQKRMRPLDQVVDDIRACVDAYGSRTFNFTDEYFRVSEMLALIDRLEAHDISIQWDAYARLEPILAEPHIAGRLAAGGARFLQFGLETASPHLLKTIRKGTRTATAAHIFKALDDVGVWSHVFIIVGLPSECLHDSLLTAAFLLANDRHIFTIKPTRFQLSRHSPFAIHKNSPYIAVEDERAQQLDLALNLPFRYTPLAYCKRCESLAELRPASSECPTCADKYQLRNSLSRRGVNAMYAAMELVAAHQWSYPFTSLYPYHVRLLFSPNEARSIASDREQDVDRCLGFSPTDIREIMSDISNHLKWEARHIGRIRDVYEYCGLDRDMPKLSTYDEFCRAAVRWSEACISYHPNHGSHVQTGSVDCSDERLVVLR